MPRWLHSHMSSSLRVRLTLCHDYLVVSQQATSIHHFSDLATVKVSATATILIGTAF